MLYQPRIPDDTEYRFFRIVKAIGRYLGTLPLPMRVVTRYGALCAFRRAILFESSIRADLHAARQAFQKSGKPTLCAAVSMAELVRRAVLALNEVELNYQQALRALDARTLELAKAS